MTTTPCYCESVHHFPATTLPGELAKADGAGTGHGYMAVPATRGRSARWVGEICEDCATTHMAPYLNVDQPEILPAWDPAIIGITGTPGAWVVTCPKCGVLTLDSLLTACTRANLCESANHTIKE